MSSLVGLKGVWCRPERQVQPYVSQAGSLQKGSSFGGMAGRSWIRWLWLGG